jgi:UDP-2,4-diacetamido-2,4,6-trideoxy-beta-L-altropyranose hydrolase
MSSKIAVFRVDASFEIGTGHVVRCLALSARLRNGGFDVTFVCRELPGDLCHTIQEKGFRVYRLKEPGRQGHSIQPNNNADMRETQAMLRLLPVMPAWLIVDHYHLDASWEQGLRSTVRKIMVIDDVPARQHVCDFLIDQNCYDSMRERYRTFVPPGCTMLLGPDFAMVRPEFIAARGNGQARNGKVKRVLVFLGGSDPTNQTLKVLDAFRLLNCQELSLDILIGINNVHRSKIENAASVLPRSVCHFNASNVSELMAAADLYIGSPGIATWERCCVGLPSIIMTTHPAQVETAQYLHSKKISLYMGESRAITAEQIAASVSHVISNPEMLSEFSKNSLATVDGQGVERCFREMRKACDVRPLGLTRREPHAEK